MRKTLDEAAPDKKDFHVVSGMGDDSQGDMFAIPESRLEIRKVEEKTKFVGLGRSKSWLDVVRGWQMTGQVDFIKCGGDMCGQTECGK